MSNETELTLRGRYQRWIEALRSGKYEQGKGNLKKDGKYCCLGVLVEVEGAEFPPENLMPTYSMMADTKLCEYAKLLSEMNDRGANFCEIADTIETWIMPEMDDEAKQITLGRGNHEDH